MNDNTAPWMPCPKSEDGGHDFNGLRAVVFCECGARTLAPGDCNAAARHIVGLQREVERLKGDTDRLLNANRRAVDEVETLRAQLAAIATSPAPLTTARKRKINHEETPYDAGRPWPKDFHP